MIEELDYIAIGVSAATAIFTIIFWKKEWGRVKRYHGFEARQRIDEVISSFEFKIMKKQVSEKYFEMKNNGKENFVLSDSDVAEQTLKLEHGFNKVCSWYEEEDWVDKENFDKTYAGNVVNSWNLLKGDIQYIREKSNNDKFCEHFESVAEQYIKQGIEAPLYDLKSKS